MGRTDDERREGTADAQLPEAGESGESASDGVPAAQEQPPSFGYGSAAAGTARDAMDDGDDAPADA